MSTRARITILSKDGESNTYTRSCDGYPSGVLRDFPQGKYTYEQLRQALYLEDYFVPMPNYFYEFDLQQKLVCIYGANFQEYPWVKGKVEYQGTIIDAIREYVDEDYSENELSSVLPTDKVWDILTTVFIPLANIAFTELDKRLHPLFSYAAMEVLLSTKVDFVSRDAYSVDIHAPLEKVTGLPEVIQIANNTKSMWLTYSVAMANEASPSLQRFMIRYHLELLSDSYQLMGMDKNFAYGTYPNPAEIYKVLNVIMDKVDHILQDRIDSIFSI